MDDHEQEVKDLKQALLDERSLRHAAEKRSSELTERAGIWRTRAEERAARIDRLVAERPGSVLSWLRPKASSPPKTPAVEPIPSDRRREFPAPGLRSVRVAAVVADRGISAALDSMDRRAIVDGGSIDDADLVVVEPAALQDAPDSAGLRDLLGQRQGPPVVVWDPVGAAAPSLDDHWIRVSLPPSFNLSSDNPAVRWKIEDAELVADASRVKSPDQELVGHAAAGGVVLARSGVVLDEPARSMASTVARRWAFRHHAPWTRAKQLAAAAGVEAFDPWPSVAAVIVSNRPDLLPSALKGMAEQTYHRLRFVVGLHGVGDASAVANEAESLGILDRTQILEIPAAETLGAALNRCVDAADADVIAKIDDDDTYGPCHLEDSVHALAYSGAGIAGKATQFFYFASTDQTVLRRPGVEESFISGTPTGATLVFRRAVWEANRFPHRPRQVDVHFVRGARLAGTEIYVGSRWEFRAFRGHDRHIWTSSDEALLAGSVPAFTGNDPQGIHASGWPLNVD